MTRVEWVPLSERARWRSALEGIEHGFLQEPEYSAAAAGVTGHEPGLWTWRDEHGKAVCPVARRPAPGGGFDLVTPLGFGGFATAGSLAGMTAGWSEFWRDEGALAAYVQMSPWQGPDLWRTSLEGFGDALRPSRECWLWDLRPQPADLAAGMHPNHRRWLQKWKDTACFDADELKPAFDRLYADFLRRSNVGSAYHFTPTALAELGASPGALWIGGRDEAGGIEAVAIFLWNGRYADLFLSAATQPGRRQSRALYWQAAQRLREHGVHWLNLGGGVADGDPLSQFKKRFGARPCRTLALRQVLDADGFRRACDVAGVPAASATVFPPWRAA